MSRVNALFFIVSHELALRPIPNLRFFSEVDVHVIRYSSSPFIFSVEVSSSSMEVYRTGYLTSNVLTTSEEGTYFCRAYFETYTIESERATVSLVRKFTNHNFSVRPFPRLDYASNEALSFRKETYLKMRVLFMLT